MCNVLCKTSAIDIGSPPASSPVDSVVWISYHKQTISPPFCTKSVQGVGCQSCSAAGMSWQGVPSRYPRIVLQKQNHARAQRASAWPRGREPQPLTVSLARQFYSSNQHVNLLLLQKCQASALCLLLKMWFLLPPALPGTLFF